ncbi:MAG: GGDEF domain-containing protein [Treponema sp.]|nr:GGDEF domain-containing protein [Treponema sp.]
MHFESIKDICTFSYVSLTFLCAIVISILIYTTAIDIDHTKKRGHLLNVLIAVFLYCIADSFWAFAFNGVILERSPASRYATNVILYIIMSICSYAICRFLLSLIESINGKRVIKSRYLFIPFALCILLSISTIWTSLLFSIDLEGNLIKGPLYFLFMTILFGYVIIFGISSFILCLRTQNDFAKEQYKLVFIYTIPAITGSFIHYFNWDLPTFSIGFTIATLIIYIFQMRDLISLDGLTGISNRRKGERFFQEQIKRINEEPHSSRDCLYLFMMDLNKFKAINDTYGHTEGDRALVATAQVLKEACSHIRRRCIMSRFGGDEFVIGVVFTPEEAHLLQEKIQNLIIQKNEELKAPWKISLSTGFTYYKKEFKNFTNFLAHCDRLMYEKKQEAHKSLD